MLDAGNDENGDGATQTELVDNWMENPNPDSNQIKVVPRQGTLWLGRQKNALIWHL